jgi:hypothetical protein
MTSPAKTSRPEKPAISKALHAALANCLNRPEAIERSEDLRKLIALPTLGKGLCAALAKARKTADEAAP